MVSPKTGARCGKAARRDLRGGLVARPVPTATTRLGGNKYINSASTGAWEDFLLHEMLPAIEQRFGCGGPGRRGVFGKSSGGYGAITHALRHSDIWSAAARHSGDMTRHTRGPARTCRRRELDRALVAAT
jgi:enterochelin esterase-like enzyme